MIKSLCVFTGPCSPNFLIAKPELIVLIEEDYIPEYRSCVLLLYSSDAVDVISCSKLAGSGAIATWNKQWRLITVIKT